MRSNLKRIEKKRIKTIAVDLVIVYLKEMVIIEYRKALVKMVLLHRYVNI